MADTNRAGDREEAHGVRLGPSGFDLLGALSEPDCPICLLVQWRVSSYLDRIAEESVVDPGAREELRLALGYCAAHGQEWLKKNNLLATTIIYQDVLSHAQRILDRVAGLSGAAEAGSVEQMEEANGLVGRLQSLFGVGQGSAVSGRAVAEALQPAAPCPACRYSADLEARLVSSCAEAFAHRKFMSAYRHHTTGLCLPHFRTVLPLITRPALLRGVVQAQHAILAKSCADLAEVIRKSDYRFSGEPKGDEFKTPPRSVGQAGGSLPTQLNPPKAGR